MPIVKTVEEQLEEAQAQVVTLNEEVGGLKSLMEQHDDCVSPWDIVSPLEAVDRWLDRQKLLGISDEGRATVERLLRDLE